MRTIEEIKTDIAKWEAEPMDSTRAFVLRNLRRELNEALTSGIPLDRLEEICNAERDERVFIISDNCKLCTSKEHKRSSNFCSCPILRAALTRNDDTKEVEK